MKHIAGGVASYRTPSRVSLPNVSAPPSPRVSAEYHSVVQARPGRADAHDMNIEEIVPELFSGVLPQESAGGSNHKRVYYCQRLVGDVL